MASPRKTVYLVDGSAQFHRAYFAIRGLATSRGLPTNATYGFTTMLEKLIVDEKPTHLGILFDHAGPTFRDEMFKDYKANRPKMDDELAVQYPYVRRVCDAFAVPVIEQPGVEADDVIATLAKQAVAQGFRVVIVTADKDLLQLVDDDVQVLNPGRDGSGSTLFDSKTVEEKWGVAPARIVDVLALMGDAVDNVPGVPGIGDKGARELIREHGSLENLLAHAADVKRKAYREGLLNHAEDAKLSKQLVTLRADVPVSFDPDALQVRPVDLKLANALFKELEFVALARKYAPPADAHAAVAVTLAADAKAVAAEVAAARKAGRFALALVPTAPQAMRARVLGVALASSPERATYIPLGHADAAPCAAPAQSDLFAAPAVVAAPRAAAGPLLEALRPLFAAGAPAYLSAQAKRDRVLLGRLGVEDATAAFDALVAAFLLNPGRRAYPLEDLVREVLGEDRAPTPVADPAALTPAAAAALGAEEASLVLRLWEPVRARLAEEELTAIHETLELALIPALADMERAGVKIDTAHLAAMSREMEGQLSGLVQQIHEAAGGEFNVNSPPQLREVLFDKLGLKSGKKTAKTREASTAEEVLEELAEQHPLPRLILDYRAIQKLKGTYVDALPEMVNPETGRIHTTFHQTGAATGRLSTSDPGLQNIPIRTPLGRRIRQAFVAEPGHVLVSADYSQIELRVLAHLSQDPTLIDTFRRGEDVHDRTAREVFGTLSGVPEDEQRRVAKMVNYALLYGKTAFTLAKDLGVSRKEAEGFIEAYFARYPKVRGFIDETLAKARDCGHVRTLLGRLRRLPDLRSKNFPVRAEAERQAMNTPVQGSAADLIKKAMIDMRMRLRAENLRTRLILQIHDELLLEAPEAEAERALALVKDVMEHALALDVPLEVDARIGKNWDEAH
ncbi:MAG: DNA polymerase I [Vicinamibacteria bacterium]|nr:DNA polymerase I [Vicinamibacteria bacterium]